MALPRVGVASSVPRLTLVYCITINGPSQFQEINFLSLAEQILGSAAAGGIYSQQFIAVLAAVPDIDVVAAFDRLVFALETVFETATPGLQFPLLETQKPAKHRLRYRISHRITGRNRKYLSHVQRNRSC
jgi:hypothetical protein